MNSLTRFVYSSRTISARTISRPLSISAIRMADKNPLDANKGSIGKEFQPDGKVGSKAEEVGGPFSSDGAVGKQFTKEGAIGGTGQKVAEQAQGDKPGMFDQDGAIGRQFKADGAIGQVGEMVGGPFSKDGAVGKNFNADGAVGGTVQENLGDSGKKN